MPSDLGIEKNFILKKLGLCHAFWVAFCLLLRVSLHEGDFFWASVISPLLVGVKSGESSAERVSWVFFKGRESTVPLPYPGMNCVCMHFSSSPFYLVVCYMHYFPIQI